MAVSSNPFLVIEISWKLFENVLFDLSAFVVSCCLVCCRRQRSHACIIFFFYIHRKDFVMVYLSLHCYTIHKLKDARKWFVPCRFKNSVRWNILGCWLLFHILCHLHKLQIKQKNRLSTTLHSRLKTVLHLNWMNTAIDAILEIRDSFHLFPVH